MKVSEWNERYLAKERSGELEEHPTLTLVEAVRGVRPGKALDLACGSGRNALWLVSRGWYTLAVDGSEAAIASLRSKADRLGVQAETRVADLTGAEFVIEEAHWDLILMSYYLRRELFEPAKQGLVPGGLIVAIVHITKPGESPTEARLRPGELKNYFEGWPILHQYEGASRDPAHKRPVAEIVARRPKVEA